MTETRLEPITAREALEMYLESIDGELSEESVYARESQLKHFVRWCEGNEDGDGGETKVGNLNDISGRDIHRFRNWRSEGLAKPTLRTNLSALKQFMQYCVTIDAVPQTLPDKIDLPTLHQGENERETFMDEETAKRIAKFQETFNYASLDHVLILLAWQGGLRLSSLHSIDVGDIDFENEQIELVNREEEGTRLKNGDNGERIVAYPSSTLEVVADYLEHNRIESTDEYEREPLFSTKNGRMHKRYLPKRIYQMSCPCKYGRDCPSGKVKEECEYAQRIDKSLECPHNHRPHDVRRGAITNWLKRDVPERVISDRMNVSVKTLKKHYDARTEQEKTDIRRDHVEDVF